MLATISAILVQISITLGLLSVAIAELPLREIVIEGQEYAIESEDDNI